MSKSSVLDKLKAFDIKQNDIDAWEKELGLDIPTSMSGEKQYSPLHVNLFKNIKKHLILGRSIDDIKRLIILPKSSITSSGVPSQKDEAAHSAVSEETELESLLQAEMGRVTPKEQKAVEQHRQAVEAAFDQALQDQFPKASLDTHLPKDTYATHPLKTAKPPSPPAAISQPSVESSSRVAKEIKPFVEEVQSRIVEDLKQQLDKDPTLPGSDSKSIQTYFDAVKASAGDLVEKAKTSQSISGKVQQKLERQNILLDAVQADPVLPGSKDLAGPNANMLVLVDRLMKDQEAAHRQITDLEKLNAHLYHSNALFQDRIKILTQDLELTKQAKESEASHQEAAKLLNEKSALQKQLLDYEQRYKTLEHNYEAVLDQLGTTRQRLSRQCEPELFVGQWYEEATLQHVVFDNFGVSIDPKRTRLFKVSTPPERVFGMVAVFEHTFDYQSNPLWKRYEMLTLTHKDDNLLVGELITEYILDETPVAKAIYQVRCQRKTAKKGAK